ncbi:hypothetical protein AVEN_20014-1 [Araneus ventricosus]|uniref:Uncharacterized protein n=1 Tax=Araneus ventricosus TaxID=182803 RepID=A0A4Y2PEC2_ARAVE|nr:hypothetical protein AVEN_20014-1 [Araneus ventricosus]
MKTTLKRISQGELPYTVAVSKSAIPLTKKFVARDRSEMMDSWSVFNRLENAHDAVRAPPHVPQPNRLNGHGTKGCHPGTEPRNTELQAQCLDNCTIGAHTRC